MTVPPQGEGHVWHIARAQEVPIDFNQAMYPCEVIHCLVQPWQTIPPGILGRMSPALGAEPGLATASFRPIPVSTLCRTELASPHPWHRRNPFLRGRVLWFCH